MDRRPAGGRATRRRGSCARRRRLRWRCPRPRPGSGPGPATPRMAWRAARWPARRRRAAARAGKGSGSWGISRGWGTPHFARSDRCPTGPGVWP
ncbi:MAG: hypothetical protein EOP73_16995 [Variovorax sp.]|nr:MAG: hypothetical protein EOP73_16995 [Variovorax sp.]